MWKTKCEWKRNYIYRYVCVREREKVYEWNMSDVSTNSPNRLKRSCSVWLWWDLRLWWVSLWNPLLISFPIPVKALLAASFKVCPTTFAPSKKSSPTCSPFLKDHFPSLVKGLSWWLLKRWCRLSWDDSDNPARNSKDKLRTQNQRIRSNWAP